MRLKLISTMPSEEMTVQSRRPKPIQPKVATSNASMRSKSALEMVRAWAARMRRRAPFPISAKTR